MGAVISQMSQKPKFTALRASLLYVLIAFLWASLSDLLVDRLTSESHWALQFEIYGDWLFVGITGTLLFFILRNHAASYNQKIHEVKKAETLTNLQRETMEKIAGGKPLKETLEILLRGIEAHSPDMICSVLLLEGAQLRHGAAPSLPEAYVKAIDGATIGPKVGSCGTAAFRGSPVFVSDIAIDPLWTDFKHLALPHGLRSCWSTPILDEQKKVLGTFAIYHRNPGLPHDEDVRVIELVTNTAATAIVKERVERNLRGSEERFRTLVEQASDAIFVHDAEGHLLEVNESACASLGYTRKELLRMMVTDIEQEMTPAEVRQFLRQLRPGQSQTIRAKHRRKDGTAFPTEVSLSCYEIQGQLVFAALVRNLSERKQYEDQLAQSVSLLRATIESGASGLLVVDLAGKVTLHNHRFLELWRIPAEIMATGDDEMLLKLVLDQLAEPDAFLKRVQELYQQPDRESFDTLHFKDGRVFERTSLPQRLGDKIIGRVWNFHDVTEKQRAEEATRQERRLLRTMIDLAPDFIFVKDGESRYLVVNESLAKCYRQQPAEMLGRTDADFVSAELATRFRRSELEVLETGTLHAYEDTLCFPDGQTRTVVTNMVAFRDDRGEVSGLIGIGHDVTSQKQTEKSVRLQSGALNAAANAILITDPKGNIEWANPAFTHNSGYALEECLGRNPRDLVRSGKHDRDFFRRMWQTILAGKVWQGELTNRRKDGSLYQEEMTITPLLDEQNRVTHFVAIKQDVTERNQSTETLLTSQALYSSLVEQMPVCVFRKDAAGRFEFVNSQFCRLKQLKPEEIIGRTPPEMATYKLSREPNTNLADTNDYNFSVVGANHHATIMKTGQNIELDEEYVTADGEVRFFHVLKTPVFDSQKKIVGSQGVMFDVTERRRTDEKLRQANERTQFYMSRLPLGFIAWDEDFCVTEWNPAAERMFGWTATEAMGRHAYELIVPSDIQPLVNKVWQEVIAGGNPASHSINENLAKDGRRLTCEWRNLPLRNAHGQICGCLSIIEDITERIRSEKQRAELEVKLRQSQKMEAIGQLSGGIAHDFNNILTVIQGNAALLQSLDLQPGETRDCSNQISRAAERAAGLTRQLLMFARKQEMRPVNLDLNETVAQITKMLQRILGEDVTLRTEYAPALPLIHADVGMLEQIVLNLAVNARDAMATGGKLTLRTSAEKRRSKDSEKEETHVCLQIADTGCGIAPEILPRIFEPFFTTKEVGKGTGLGLATVYGIVQQHHGNIRVQSEPGQGATFTVSFPAVGDSETIRATPPPKPVLPRSTETILLVEDELPLRTFVSDLLQRCGYAVLEAESGPAALKVWGEKRETIDLLFTDVIMPEAMNGIELGHRLLAEKPALKVIYTSGYTGNLEGHRQTLVEGVNFIRKPYKPETLAEMIRKNLDGKTAGK